MNLYDQDGRLLDSGVLDPPAHVQLRGNRRVIAEQLEQAVRDRDAGAMQLAASRLSRLGVSHDRIVSMATEAACKRGPQR